MATNTYTVFSLTSRPGAIGVVVLRSPDALEELRKGIPDMVDIEEIEAPNGTAARREYRRRRAS